MTKEQKEKLKKMTGHEFYSKFGGMLLERKIGIKEYNVLYKEWRNSKGLDELIDTEKQTRYMNNKDIH